MTANLMPLVKQQFNQNGVPLSGGKLFVYAAGTTTKSTSFTDSTGSTPNTNPVILDANGQASVWLDPTQFYKFVLSPSTDTDPPTNSFWSIDNVSSPSPVAVGNMTDELGSGGTPGFAKNVDFTPGVTTSLTLSTNYGSASNLWVSFDSADQGADSFTLSGETLAFNAPIPVGVNKVFVKGGTSLSIGTPAPGTVNDSNLNPGSVVSIITQNVWTLKRFGCKVDGVTDDTANVIKAVQSGEKAVFVDAGQCVIDGTINFNLSMSLIGWGKGQSQFLVKNGNLAAFKMGASLSGVLLRDFSIIRNVAAVSGGDGIDWSAICAQSEIIDVNVQGCYRGFVLGPTDYSKVVRAVAENGYDHGFHVTNGSTGQPCQWSISDSLAQANDGIGLFIDGTSNAGGGMSLGELVNFSTFGNSSFGLLAQGSIGNPINGLRILGGFLGQDGQTEIYLDTYGGQHKIVGAEMELTGTGPTGHALQTPASHLGSGIVVTANNQRVQVSDPNINGTSESGINMNGTVLSISNPHITNCGLALITGDRNGIVQSAGRTMVTGGYIADTGSNTQSFGASVGAGAVMHLTGVDLTGNTGAPTTGAGTIVESNCLP